MKISLFQWTLLSVLFFTAQSITASPFDNSKFLQEKYFSPKRTKPSLSIVNPLDVLRSRVMLEMARRQRENANKQAEINKEFLKSIGKRGSSADINDIEDYLRNRYYDTARLYAPYYQSNEQPASTNNNEVKVPSSLISSNVVSQNLQDNVKHGVVGKAQNDETTNGQEQQVYVIDDLSNNIDDTDDSQLKYLYSLYKNRLHSNI